MPGVVQTVAARRLEARGSEISFADSVCINYFCYGESEIVEVAIFDAHEPGDSSGFQENHYTDARGVPEKCPFAV